MGGVAAIIGISARKNTVINKMIHTISHRGGGSHCICCADKMATIAQSPHFDFHINIPEKYKGLFVALDGQIDNHQEILGNEFLHFSFAERDHLAIFEAYRKWGNEFPSKLKGTFAFVLYDKNKQNIIAVRDHFGIKPMYYSRQGNVVYFGSELKSLLVTLENNMPNYSVLLEQYATSACENMRETVFMGIHQLLPGEQLVTDGDNIKIQKYYELQNHVKVDDNLSEKESNERFFELFTDIVYRSVERENKVGLFFSGGIDSSSLAAAANFKKMNLHAYIGISEDNKPEEIKIIKGMLNEARIPLNVDFNAEFSHHYGVLEFPNVGATIIDCVNREYCKKLIVQLPGQHHPAHYHKKKDETFQVLYGTVEMEIEGRRRTLQPGDTQVVQQGVWHEFWTESGAILEEISTTHYSDDSFYEDKQINQIDRSLRKTVVEHWGRYQL